jgi:hypothetical protein
MDSHLFKTKSIEQLITDVERGERALRRSLSAWDLTLLGIGGIIGGGVDDRLGRDPRIRSRPVIPSPCVSMRVETRRSVGRHACY